MTNELLPTKSKEITESEIINDQPTLKPRQKYLHVTPITAAPTPAQEEFKQKINIENEILMGLYRKRDPWTTLTKRPQGDYIKGGNAKKVQDRSKTEGSCTQTVTENSCNSKM